MGELTILSIPTTLDIPADRILEAAKAHCEHVLILGEDVEGEPYIAATTGDKAQLLLWMETFKLRLLSGEFG